MGISEHLVKNAKSNNDFVISQPTHLLWVLKRAVSTGWFF